MIDLTLAGNPGRAVTRAFRTGWGMTSHLAENNGGKQRSDFPMSDFPSVHADSTSGVLFAAAPEPASGMTASQRGRGELL
ncbi:hypothetical protein [Antarctobacter jejuensis]|uniref:hypothetical protein n=1 Tax=Antarctobacter jejuensis TaxID=1439938 RepID=UPI003FD2B1A2